METKVLQKYQKVTQVDVEDGIVCFQFHIELLLNRKKLKLNGNNVIRVGRTDSENPTDKQISKCTNVLWEDYQLKPKFGEEEYAEKDKEICDLMHAYATRAAYDIIFNARRLK